MTVRSLRFIRVSMPMTPAGMAIIARSTAHGTHDGAVRIPSEPNMRTAIPSDTITNRPRSTMRAMGISAGRSGTVGTVTMPRVYHRPDPPEGGSGACGAAIGKRPDGRSHAVPQCAAWSRSRYRSVIPAM